VDCPIVGVVISQADSPCTDGRRDRCGHNARRHDPAWVRDAAGSAAASQRAIDANGPDAHDWRVLIDGTPPDSANGFTRGARKCDAEPNQGTHTMPERIYTSAGDGKLEAFEETPFPTEDEFHALIAEHLESLDGEQIRRGDARRWSLVSREKGIGASAGEGARWSVDHLIIDQDAVPTLAEVKRGSNPDVRRTIVGQLLKYAAHASETWTAEELREACVRQAKTRSRDAKTQFATLPRWGPRRGQVPGGRLQLAA